MSRESGARKKAPRNKTQSVLGKRVRSVCASAVAEDANVFTVNRSELDCQWECGRTGPRGVRRKTSPSLTVPEPV